MTESPDSSAPQGTEESTRVELPGPSFQPSEVDTTLAEEPRPNLDQRQAAISRDRRAAGPEATNQEDRDSLEDEHSKLGSDSPNDPKWDDYLSCRRHTPSPETWVASGYTLEGGGARTDILPRLVRLSRV